MIDPKEPFNIPRAVQLNTVLKISGCQPARLWGCMFHEGAEEEMRKHWSLFLEYVNKQLYGEPND